MDFISLATGSHRLLRQLEQDYATTTSQETRPLLSPTAEGELFLLATNFLLCTCMYYT
jgi:hypothetical protein